MIRNFLFNNGSCDGESGDNTQDLARDRIAGSIADAFELGPDPEREILDRLTLLNDDGSWQGPSGPIDRRHFRWHVMVEFLCEVEGLDRSRLVAILPLGAVEAHGPHLPLATDGLIAGAMADDAARRLAVRGWRTRWRAEAPSPKGSGPR